jgi:hypothetical protein
MKKIKNFLFELGIYAVVTAVWIFVCYSVSIMCEITGLLFSIVGPLALVVILWSILAISKRKPPKRNSVSKRGRKNGNNNSR